MRGAVSFARIILSLSDADIALLREDEAFDDVTLWLAGWRSSTIVDAALRRLVGAAPTLA